jgi:hypothetical protein
MLGSPPKEFDQACFLSEDGIRDSERLLSPYL